MKHMDQLPSHRSPKVISRIEAIGRLRHHLKTLTDDEHSMCQVAAKKGIFCRGFARWSDEELKKHFAGLVRQRPKMNRWQLEELANRWELARQVVQNVTLACDAQTKEHDTCRGWDDFSNQELERFCADLLAMDAVVAESGAPEANGPI
jgi:hypothetical protein